MIERMTNGDGGGRVVAVVIALVALSYPFVACWSYLDQLSLARSQLRRLEELQSETEEAKKVENEYFIKELLAAESRTDWRFNETVFRHSCNGGCDFRRRGCCTAGSAGLAHAKLARPSGLLTDV